MCLACELDAMWYAEWERLTAERANAPTAAGVPSAPSGEPVSAPGTIAESGAPMVWNRDETESADGTAAAAPPKPTRPGVSSGFRCEEAE